LVEFYKNSSYKYSNYIAWKVRKIVSRTFKISTLYRIKPVCGEFQAII